MAIYMQATLELGYKTLPIFLNIAPKMKVIVEQSGSWQMISALVSKIGPANTVVHTWRLPDMNAFDTGVQAIAAHEEAGAIFAALCESGAKETICFFEAAPYCPNIA
jgi:hypothetical protein